MIPLVLCLALATSDPAADLGLELADLTPLEAPDGLRLYRARGAGPADRQARDLTIASLELGAPLAGARLTCAVGPEGRLVHATVVGHPDVEGEQATPWALFLGQLCEYGLLGPVDEFARNTARNPADLASWRAEQGQTEDGALIEFLIQQRATMRAMTLLQRNLVLDPRPIDAGALTAIDARLVQLERGSGVLELVLGEKGRDTWRQELIALRERIAGLVDVDPTEYQSHSWRLCGSCHAQAAPEGGDWTERLSSLRGELGFPLGALVVDYDVAPASGDDGSRSQQLADGVRTLLEAVARMDAPPRQR